MGSKPYDQTEIDRILKEVCTTPPPGGSKLTPYRELIAALRKKGVSYRRIQKILAGEGLSVSYNAICQFVKVRRIGRPPRKPMYELEPTSAPPAGQPSLKELVQKRWEERERAGQTAQKQEPPKRFEYTSGQPLTLMPPDTITKCARLGCGHSRAEHDNSLSQACSQCYCQGWIEPKKSS